MKNWIMVSLLWLGLGGIVNPARADSPITSTPIADVYLDIPLVKTARKTGTLTPEMAQFLSSNQHPIDQKAALINALSWRVEGKQNARIYENFLRSRYGELNLKKLTPHELFGLAYLTVMDDYFNPERAMPLFDQALLRNRQSLTVGLIRILNRAQIVMAQPGEWCRVWRLADGTNRNRTLRTDLRPAARQIILDYMVLYRDSCPRNL
ncbi:putative cell wall binding repeat 2-containing protein hypothetical protein [Gloeomargarita lithophora Alchichica-D10]|uniref:DUF1400 domain-containing protein n=1 Tax=Gloeomargarita lithophora Alchichica-D10 TaxID=1188229 RepID=A0A1J0AH29_9CYAN|nr:hypothetical protein [Gloeomargarita lithophora]APB35252.1 putative cell wall binding repeat 2-containing protein hypothetical protein [Gloeomargarita lithophora Alchichica-D10]